MPKAEIKAESSLSEGGVVHNPPQADQQPEPQPLRSPFEEEEAPTPPPAPQEPATDE